MKFYNGRSAEKDRHLVSKKSSYNEGLQKWSVEEENSSGTLEDKVYIDDYLQSRRYNKRLVNKLRQDIITELRGTGYESKDFRVYFSMSAKYQSTNIIVEGEDGKDNMLLSYVEDVLDSNDIQYDINEDRDNYFVIDYDDNQE